MSPASRHNSLCRLGATDLQIFDRSAPLGRRAHCRPSSYGRENCPAARILKAGYGFSALAMRQSLGVRDWAGGVGRWRRRSLFTRSLQGQHSQYSQSRRGVFPSRFDWIGGAAFHKPARRLSEIFKSRSILTIMRNYALPLSRLQMAEATANRIAPPHAATANSPRTCAGMFSGIWLVKAC